MKYAGHEMYDQHLTMGDAYDEMKERESSSAQPACSISDSDRLNALIGALDVEAADGGWRVSLEYNNYQDVAYVRNGNGDIIAQCGDVDKDLDELFRTAIDSLIGN